MRAHTAPGLGPAPEGALGWAALATASQAGSPDRGLLPVCSSVAVGKDGPARPRRKCPRVTWGCQGRGGPGSAGLHI